LSLPLILPFSFSINFINYAPMTVINENGLTASLNKYQTTQFRSDKKQIQHTIKQLINSRNLFF
jgi:hypothetical protein